MSPRTNPRVAVSNGAIAYLLRAGAGTDSFGYRAWELPPELITDVVDEHPRLDFKHEFSAIIRAEADAVPSKIMAG
jgi:hypothetical protein